MEYRDNVVTKKWQEAGLPVASHGEGGRACVFNFVISLNEIADLGIDFGLNYGF